MKRKQHLKTIWIKICPKNDDKNKVADSQGDPEKHTLRGNLKAITYILFKQLWIPEQFPFIDDILPFLCIVGFNLLAFC